MPLPVRVLDPVSPRNVQDHGSGSRTTSRFYRPELDALRFFAFLCVFAFHWLDYVPTDPKTQPLAYSICTAGAFGVPIFFLLSSFLIIELLLREREQTGNIHIKSFYVRRILRIWPLYFAVFWGLVLLGQFLPNIATNNPWAWLAFTFFTGNWYIMRHGWIAGSIDPLWSIAVEEQFYIAIPLLTKFGGRKLLALVSAGLLVISYLLSAHYARLVYSGESGQWVNSWFQFQFFAAGAILAIVLHQRVPRWHLLARGLMFIAGTLLWIFAVLGPGVKSYDAHTTVAGGIFGWLMVLGGSVLFFLSVLGIHERFVPRWLTYLGRISFGLYMFHSLVYHLVFHYGSPYLKFAMTSCGLPVSIVPFAGTMMVLLITIALASLSYTFFEKPFLKLKERFTFVRSRPE